MKRLAYITAVILSLLVIYTGAGISIVHYCCARCEVVKSCCEDSCSKCEKSHACDSKKDCQKEGCTVTIIKPDLTSQTSVLMLSVPVMTLFCEQIYYLLNLENVEKPEVIAYSPSPPPLCPRHRLALHAVFLI